MGVRSLTVLACVGAAFAARQPVLLRTGAEADDADLAVTAELVDKVNNDGTHTASWRAAESEFFKGMTMEQARKLMGTKLETANDMPMRHPAKTYDHIPDSDIPASFDARDKWPKFIHPIRNQLMCGSCWAFAASEVLSDRFAIATNGTTNVVLSPEDLVSCDAGDMGCQGGYLEHAWDYLKSTGIVTETCFPYDAGTGVAPSCEKKCKDSEPYTKYKSSDAFQLTSVADIQKAIMTDGPVEAGFTVYKSFMSYASGVYHHHWWMFWDQVMGGHAIKIVGWGEEDGTPYWLVANSWSSTWGEDGYFRMKRGTNECQIESQVFAGHAAVKL